MYFHKVVILLIIITGCTRENLSIREAVEAQLHQYPASTLQDIYKSFFQDEFGPGHLVPDSAGAAEYLIYELSVMVSRGNLTAEPCGTGQHFYRVPLDLVKDGIIPPEVYLSAFLASAGEFKPPEISTWKTRWQIILREIEKMDLYIPGYETDKMKLGQLLDTGEFVVHHSKIYSDAYDPHYRIMNRTQWQQLKERYKL